MPRSTYASPCARQLERTSVVVNRPAQEVMASIQGDDADTTRLVVGARVGAHPLSRSAREMYFPPDPPAPRSLMHLRFPVPPPPDLQYHLTRLLFPCVPGFRSVKPVCCLVSGTLSNIFYSIGLLELARALHITGCVYFNVWMKCIFWTQGESSTQSSLANRSARKVLVRLAFTLHSDVSMNSTCWRLQP